MATGRAKRSWKPGGQVASWTGGEWDAAATRPGGEQAPRPETTDLKGAAFGSAARAGSAAGCGPARVVARGATTS